MEKTKRLQPGDFMFLILTLGLVIFGVIMVFSASYYSSINNSGNPYSYLIKELIFAVTGFILMIGAALLDVRYYKKWAPYLMIFSIILLVLVVTPLGTEVNGAKRWLGAGVFTLMPGEIVKLCAIIFVAWFLSRKPEVITSFTRGILPLFFLCGIIAALVMLQPNMSTAITVVGIILVMMFIAGMKYKYLIGLLIVGGVAGCGLIFSDPDGYRLDRVTSFRDPFKDAAGDGYQVVQSLLALGSGGIFGLGLGKSVQKTLYLPEPQNDFILAIIGEELGLVGILVLLVVYLLLIWRGIKIAMEAPDRFSMLLASGITVMIGLQVVLNVAVVTSSMPATGVILPFVSYGGNALWLFMIAAGIMINISRHGKKRVEEER
ncbi:MAG: putative lipid II flippase FtsW [Eubacteriaceae bacterium]|nr:putative lipid II flippase FtsW [Eubacteriaceae bacterium]